MTATGRGEGKLGVDASGGEAHAGDVFRLLNAAGYELRMHLAPYDDHDDVLAAQRSAWPQQQQDAWKSHQRARVEAGRPIVEAESRRRARAAHQ